LGTERSEQITRICPIVALPRLACTTAQIGGYFAAQEALHSVQPSPVSLPAIAHRVTDRELQARMPVDRGSWGSCGSVSSRSQAAMPEVAEL
jgi:hypothetical protein